MLIPSGDSSVDPWTWPADAFPTQRLYRAKYDGPEGRLGFKLTLYLESAERYRLQAVDLVGRKVWELDLDGEGGALLIDHRNQRFCRMDRAGELTMAPLGRFPLVAIPRLLLGLLPADPAREVQIEGETLSYRDDSGQLWQASWQDGQLAWWTLGEAGDPLAYWRREDGIGGIFSDRRGQQQLRWNETVREGLPQSLDRPQIPASYEFGSCVPASE